MAAPSHSRFRSTRQRLVSGPDRGPGLGASSIEVDLADRSLALTAISPYIIRVRSSSDGRWHRPRPWAVAPPDNARGPVAVERTVGANGSSLATTALMAVVDADGALSISTVGGPAIVQDAPGRAVSFDARRSVASWRLAMPPDRRYFGFGERTGPLDRRGRRNTCWTTDEWRHQGPSTDPLYVAIPWHIGLDPDGRAFGIFLNATHRSAFDLTDLDGATLEMEVAAQELDWYLVWGPGPSAVLERFTALIGRPALPPRWALGYQQARWSYASDAEVRQIAERLRANRIPADAITLDIDHMDRYRVFTWDRSRFPDPQGLIADLRAAGFRTMVIVDAAVKQDPGAYDVYDDGHRHGRFVRTAREPGSPELTGYVWPGVSVFPDHFRPEVRRWWGDLYRRYTRVGVAGFLNDMNEPAMHDRPIGDPDSDNLEPPPDTPFGPPDAEASHAEIRNLYALLQTEATFEGLRRARPTRRPFVVTRAGFAGVQRWAAVWTGDNMSDWEHLRMSLPQLLNLGLSGVAVAGADIGGFFADCPSELLVRWAQLGAFYPLARNNSANGTARQEPWSRGEPTTTRYRRALELRYRLMPYLYTLAQEASSTGRPILRPLFFHYAADPVAQALDDEALLGRDLLLAPVLGPGRTDRAVYLPDGDWYDLRTFVMHAGGRSILASAGLDEDLPVFARAGSIIPMAPILAWTDEQPLDPLTLHVFLDRAGRARGRMYEDDGESAPGPACHWSVSRWAARTTDDGRIVVLGRRRGAWVPPHRTVKVILHGGGVVTATRTDSDRWRLEMGSGAASDRA